MLGAVTSCSFDNADCNDDDDDDDDDDGESSREKHTRLRPATCSLMCATNHAIR